VQRAIKLKTKTKNIMKQYHIFHAIADQFKFTETVYQPRIYVGFVQATSIEQAYFLSQNQEELWNKDFIPHVWDKDAPCRSTSVGDVIQDDDKFFMVCGTGFKELVHEEDEA